MPSRAKPKTKTEELHELLADYEAARMRGVIDVDTAEVIAWMLVHEFDQRLYPHNGILYFVNGAGELERQTNYRKAGPHYARTTGKGVAA